MLKALKRRFSFGSKKKEKSPEVSKEAEVAKEEVKETESKEVSRPSAPEPIKAELTVTEEKNGEETENEEKVKKGEERAEEEVKTSTAEQGKKEEDKSLEDGIESLSLKSGDSSADMSSSSSTVLLSTLSSLTVKDSTFVAEESVSLSQGETATPLQQMEELPQDQAEKVEDSEKQGNEERKEELAVIPLSQTVQLPQADPESPSSLTVSGPVESVKELEKQHEESERRGIEGETEPSSLSSDQTSPPPVSAAPKYPLLESYNLSFDQTLEQVFDKRLVSLLSAEKWQERESALQQVENSTKDWTPAAAPTAQRKKGGEREREECIQKAYADLLTATFAVIQRGIDDKTAPVMYRAMETLRAVSKTILSRVPPLSLSPLLEEQLCSLFSALLHRVNDSTKRTQREACKAILRLLRVKNLPCLSLCARELYAEDNALLARLTVLKLVLQEIGYKEKEGLSLSPSISLCVSALQLTDEKVRKAAASVVVLAYTLVGEEALLPLLQGLKSSTLKALQKKFAEAKQKKAGDGPEEDNDEDGNSNQEGEKTDEEEEVPRIPSQNNELEERENELLEQSKEFIGPVLLHSLSKQQWSDRKEALETLQKRIEERKKDWKNLPSSLLKSTAEKEGAACLAIVRRSFADKSAPVYYAGTDFFRVVLKIYSSHISWKEETARKQVEALVSPLLLKMADNNRRTQRDACKNLLKIARLEEAAGLRSVYVHLMQEETTQKTQLNLLRLLIPEFGFQKGCINLKAVMKVARKALDAPDEKTRKSAIDVVVAAYRVIGEKRVRKYLEGLKPALLKVVEQHFSADNNTGEQDKEGEKEEGEGAELPPEGRKQENQRPERQERRQSGVPATGSQPSAPEEDRETEVQKLGIKGNKSKLVPLSSSSVSQNSIKPLGDLQVRGRLKKEPITKIEKSEKGENQRGQDAQESSVHRKTEETRDPTSFGEAFDDAEAALMASIVAE